MYRFIAELGLDARRAESGSERDSGNERERGERAVMEADKVRNWVRGRGLGRRCMRGIAGEASVSSTGRTGKGKEEPCDVVGVAGALPVSQDPDPDDAQDMVGLGSAYRGSSSSRGSGTSRSGVDRPGVDAGESSDSDGGNGERERRIATKRSVGDEDSGLKSASNASSSSSPSSPGAGVLTLSSSSSFASSSSSSSSMTLAQYVLVATNPWLSSFFPFTTARAAMRAYAACFIIMFFLVSRRSVICVLRSRARVRAHWHAFVLAVENVVVDDGIRPPDDEAGIGVEGRSVCVVFVLGLELGLMHRRRNRMEEKRLRA